MNKSIAARNVENNQENFSILFQNCPFFPWKKLCNIQHFKFLNFFNLFDFEFVGFEAKWIITPQGMYRGKYLSINCKTFPNNAKNSSPATTLDIVKNIDFYIFFLFNTRWACVNKYEQSYLITFFTYLGLLFSQKLKCQIMEEKWDEIS